MGVTVGVIVWMIVRLIVGVVVGVIVGVIVVLHLLLYLHLLLLLLVVVFVLVILIDIDKTGSFHDWRTASISLTWPRWAANEACGFRLIIVFRVEFWLDCHAVYAVLVHLLTDPTGNHHVVHTRADKDVHRGYNGRFG